MRAGKGCDRPGAAADAGDAREAGACAALLADLRQAGAERFDPLGLAFLTALERRCGAAPAAVRARLSVRLASALAAYRTRFEQAQGGASAGSPTPAPGQRTPLAGLVDRLAAARVPADASGADAAAAEGAAVATETTAAPAPAPAVALKAVTYFGDRWLRLGADQQLAEALAQAPENAGPLNSHRLILQALQTLRTLAPGYLDRVLIYADALLWLDQSAPARTPPVDAGTPGGAGSKGGAGEAVAVAGAAARSRRARSRSR